MKLYNPQKFVPGMCKIACNLTLKKKIKLTCFELFLGVGASEMGKDHAVRILDVETRMETSKPLKGHCGYLHGVQFCPLNKTIATCSEDGTIRTWDHRIKQSCTALLEPFKNEKLQQPKLGKWLGDVSINGDWLVTGKFLLFCFTKNQDFKVHIF